MIRERRSQLQELDRTVFGTRPGEVGPFEARLNTFPEIIPFVVGAFGEWSPAIDQVLKTFARMGRDVWMGRLGAPSARAAERTLLDRMRRELGMCGLRGNAQMLINRARMARMPGMAGAPSAADRAYAETADGAWRSETSGTASPPSSSRSESDQE